MTVPPPLVAGNRVQLAMRVATNLFGHNTPTFGQSGRTGSIGGPGSGGLARYLVGAAELGRRTVGGAPLPAPDANIMPGTPVRHGAGGGEWPHYLQAANGGAWSGASPTVQLSG